MRHRAWHILELRDSAAEFNQAAPHPFPGASAAKRTKTIWLPWSAWRPCLQVRVHQRWGANYIVRGGRASPARQLHDGPQYSCARCVAECVFCIALCYLHCVGMFCQLCSVSAIYQYCSACESHILLPREWHTSVKGLRYTHGVIAAWLAKAEVWRGKRPHWRLRFHCVAIFEVNQC